MRSLWMRTRNEGEHLEPMAKSDFQPQPHARVPEVKRATEYLANERTLLAWIRTSIAVISVGFLITRVTPWNARSPIGAQSSGTSFDASVLMGLVLMALG